MFSFWGTFSKEKMQSTNKNIFYNIWNARQAEAPEGAAQFQLFKKFKIGFWNLERLKKREFNFFQTSKSSKKHDFNFVRVKKSSKTCFFCKLKNAQCISSWITGSKQICLLLQSVKVWQPNSLLCEKWTVPFETWQ